ncbi:MAG: hypothetical protein KF899_04270 [Parvibaculum sp.]|nr:hypothetical protein [Parvibaculum sp.]
MTMPFTWRSLIEATRDDLGMSTDETVDEILPAVGLLVRAGILERRGGGTEHVLMTDAEELLAPSRELVFFTWSENSLLGDPPHDGKPPPAIVGPIRAIPRVAIKPPQDPIYGPLEQVEGLRNHVNAWVATILRAPSWPKRTTSLLSIIDHAMFQPESSSLPRLGRAMMLSDCISAGLEKLDEREIVSLEAATIYVLSRHPAWRAAAVEFLEPCREWFAPWLENNPEFVRFVTLLRAEDPSLPEWLVEPCPPADASADDPE